MNPKCIFKANHIFNIKMFRLGIILSRRTSSSTRPDPNRPRYVDPNQNVFRSEQKFKEERTRELKTGDKKRLLPLKTLVPEEYRGARYYTDREMEFVDPKNSKMRLFGGPYSLFFPHKYVFKDYINQWYDSSIMSHGN